MSYHLLIRLRELPVLEHCGFAIQFSNTCNEILYALYQDHLQLFTQFSSQLLSDRSVSHEPSHCVPAALTSKQLVSNSTLSVDYFHDLAESHDGKQKAITEILHLKLLHFITVVLHYLFFLTHI